jgi:hypothetical protein
MGIIRRLFTLFWVGLVLAMIGGAIGALRARQREVPAPAADADEIELLATFEPLHFQSRASAFRGGTIQCWYGGGVIDLREATLDPAGARLDVRAVFGGGQIIVPETWIVTAGVKGIGGVGDTRPRLDRATDAPHLTVEGVVMFGGYAVMSEVPEDELRGLDEQIRRWSRRGQADQPAESVIDPIEIAPEPAG